ncbi:unnamed protein product [Phaedon cochleariae]|uniref:Uncharacterized protein n=1 Tax=Phaedon cochleariae TaxID=80249 RepID=A0A9P0DVK1_PHACE|nr:unnamed protein product [Phaedon cochleariae]
MSYKLRILLLFFLLIEKCRYISTQRACPQKEVILPCRCLLRAQEYQIWCSHSNLPNVLESLKNVAKYIAHPVDELILENNFLPSLPGRTFSPLRVLRLMLRHNNLERVSSDFLAGLETSLMEIFIVEPRLSGLPELSMAQLRNLRAATIHTKLLKRLPVFSGLLKLKYIQTESAMLSELSPTNFKNLPSLEKLHISSSPKLTRLESSLLEDLPKLELINITHCGIDWIHVRAFRRLPVLKELNLSGNKLTDAGMVGRGSRELPELEVIRLDKNNLNKLGEASFVDLSSLKKLDLSNNLITHIQQGAFHRLPKLKILDVSNNALRYFHPGSFLHPSESALEEILLPHNDISNIGELSSVLDSSPRLVFLDMRHNQLRTIPFGALRGHPTIEQIDLGFNRLRSIDKEAFIAMPALRELKLANNSVSDLFPAPFWNLPALKGLDLSKNGLGRLQPMFLSNVGALRRVDLSQNLLSFVDPEAFVPTPFLEHINMSSNVLKGLHVVTLRHLRQLYEVDLSHNFLRAVPGELPRNIEYLHLRNNEITGLSPQELELPSLRVLDLSKNRIDGLPKGSLKRLVNLKRLYLGSNLITSLEEFSLDGLNNLETLDLGNNRLVQIYQNSLKPLISLRYFNVENNQISVLGSELLISSKNVLQINLSGNQLPEILARTLDTNKQTEYLDISDNLLIQIPQTVYDNTNLKKLDLTNNRIKTINATIINSLTNLRELRLTKNFIQTIEEGSLFDHKHVKTIYLDDNEIEYMEPKSIRNLPVVKSLKLNRNKLRKLPNIAFHNLPLLQSLELQQNKLRNIEPKAFSQVPHLLMLNLSHNELITLEDAGLQGLNSLELLDLSFNRISKLSGRNLDQLEWLVELRMDANAICEVSEGVFDKLLRLRLLSIRNNKIMYIPEMATQRLRSNIATIDVKGNPLSCSCNMLWLQAWIKETSQESPSCSDGTLLRELPLSSRDCPQEERQKKGLTMCDAEIFNTPNLYSTSQILSSSKYSLRNGTKNGLGGKNNLAPSPEESEYFYDYYIDYPYNDSLIDPKVAVKEKIRDEEMTTQNVLDRFLQTKSKDNIAGDTPTLYAASSTKPKPDIPQKVSHSPSNSGFTFFGLPLPDVNLKNLFGPDQARTPVMERKSAIVNDSPKSKRKFIAQMEMLQPPKMPELQGGFLPVLPGYGGFKPMPDPSIAIKNPQRKQEVVNEKQQGLQVDLQKQQVESQKQQVAPQKQQVAPQKQQVESQKQQVKPKVKGQIEALKQPQKKLNFERSQLLSNQSTFFNFTSDSLPTNRNKKSQLATIKLESIANVKIFNQSVSHNFEEHPSTESAEILNSSERTETVSFTTVVVDKMTDVVETTTVVVETSTVPVRDETTTVKPTQLNESGVVSNDSKVVENQKITQHSEPIFEEKPSKPDTQPEKKHNGSVLSAFLVPGGEQYQFKPTAKSTITKVQNPHDSNSNDASILKSSLRVSDFPDFAKVESARVENVVSDDSIITSTDEGMTETNDWYFENYNKQNVEPFVANIRVDSASTGSSQPIVYTYLLVGVAFIVL